MPGAGLMYSCYVLCLGLDRPTGDVGVFFCTRISAELLLDARSPATVVYWIPVDPQLTGICTSRLHRATRAFFVSSDIDVLILRLEGGCW